VRGRGCSSNPEEQNPRLRIHPAPLIDAHSCHGSIHAHAKLSKGHEWNMRCEVIGYREHETADLDFPVGTQNPAASSAPLPSGPFQRYLDPPSRGWGFLIQSLSRLVGSGATRPAAPIPSRFVSVDPLSTQANQLCQNSAYFIPN
jgi:hypothetical protein